MMSVQGKQMWYSQRSQRTYHIYIYTHTYIYIYKISTISPLSSMMFTCVPSEKPPFIRNCASPASPNFVSRAATASLLSLATAPGAWNQTWMKNCGWPVYFYTICIYDIYIYTILYHWGPGDIPNITNLEPWLLTTTKLLSGMRIQVDCNDRKAPNFQWILSSTCSNSVDNRIRWCYDHNNKHAMTLQVKQIFTCDHIWLYCFT